MALLKQVNCWQNNCTIFSLKISPNVHFVSLANDSFGKNSNFRTALCEHSIAAYGQFLHTEIVRTSYKSCISNIDTPLN